MPPNVPVSAAARATKASDSEQSNLGLSAANVVRLWAGHVQTTWDDTIDRPETEAAPDLPVEQGRRSTNSRATASRFNRSRWRTARAHGALVRNGRAEAGRRRIQPVSSSAPPVLTKRTPKDIALQHTGAWISLTWFSPDPRYSRPSTLATPCTARDNTPLQPQ
jgi:hypothetical protein